MWGAEPLKFALLGLGAGAAYALTGQCLVLVYRATGIINFAQSAMGMVAAFTFYEVAEVHGLPVGLSVAVSTAASALLGVLIQVGLMSRLRSASSLTRLMSTLAVLSVLLTATKLRYGSGPVKVPKVVPNDLVHLPGDIAVPVDRLVLLATAVLVTLALHTAFRVSRLGFATAAVAENERAVAALGISPGAVALANWTAAGFIGGLGAVMLGSMTRQVTADSIVLLLVPALAAALLGGFRSFGLTLAGGIALGVAESEMARYVEVPGLAKSVPFLAIIAVMMLRGRSLPIRGELTTRSSSVGTGQLNPRVALTGTAVALAVIWGFGGDWANAIANTSLVGFVVASVIVVVGYAGQLSLAQYSVAGLAAWVAARSIVNYDLGFELALVVALLVAVPVGLIVGLPAVRTRGANLAIATLGLAVVIEQMVLSNPARGGGPLGTEIGALRLFGIAIDPVDHPERYATLVALLLGLTLLLVANIRASDTGRRLIAIRSNERAAASLGINVPSLKLYAFMTASVIAALGGVLLAYRREAVTFDAYGVFNSITVVLTAVIGGIGYVGGAILGALTTPGAAGQKLTETIIRFDVSDWIGLLASVAALDMLVRNPAGIASMIAAKYRLRHGARGGESRELPPFAPELLRPDRAKTLEVRDLTVRFGGVTAVDSFNLEVRPGEIVGLIGPNGAGKTTVIDAVTGFCRPWAGTILLDGVRIDRLGTAGRANRGLSRSWQSLELFDNLTIGDNLRIAATTLPWWRPIVDVVRPRRREPLPPSAIAAAQAFGVEADLDERPEELSFGHRRRVGIARAFASRPSVLLLDEPAAGLSRAETSALGESLREVAKACDIGVVLVEHDIELVVQTCDRIVVLDQGRVLADGPPSELASRADVIEAYLGTRDEPTPRVSRIHERSGPSALAVRGLRAGYGELEAVHGVDLEVRAGEVVALLGPNGAGKTTTLLTLAGALEPLGGEIEMRGQPAARRLHQRAQDGLAIVTEERAVFMGLSLSANLRLGRGDAQRAIEFFPELAAHIHRQVGVLSGGQQQMLALGRALAAEPAVLLADELSLGLAPQIVDRLLSAVRQAADAGAAVMIVEQFAERALGIADRAYIMNRGAIVLEGDAQALRADIGSVWQAYAGSAPAEAQSADQADRQFAPSMTER